MAPAPLSTNRILTKGGMKHSCQILRSSAFDSLLSHVAGWASPRLSESSPPPLGIFRKSNKGLTKEKNSESRELRSEKARKEDGWRMGQSTEFIGETENMKRRRALKEDSEETYLESPKKCLDFSTAGPS
jgi:hypothetical protein